MALHTPTTLLLIVFVSAALAVALGVIGWRNQRELALSAGAMALHALAYVLLSQRGRLGDFLTVGVASAALSACAATLSEAVYCYQRRRPPRTALWAPVGLVALSALVLMVQVPARVIAVATLLAVQSGLLLLPLWQRRLQTPGRGQYLLAAGALLMLLIALNRVRPAFAGAGLEPQLFGAAHGQALGFAAMLLVLLLVALGMVSMVQERAESARKASQAYERFRSDMLDRLSGGQPLLVVMEAFAHGVERLHPGCACHVVLHPTLHVPPGVPAMPAPSGDAGAVPRVSFGEDDTGPQAVLFLSRAAPARRMRCQRQPVLASSHQRLGLLLLVGHESDGPAGVDTARAEELARLAGLAIERSVDAQRLRESERQYRELIESANEGICVLQDGIVRYVNPKLPELSGYAAADLLGKRFLDFVHFADRALVERNHQRRMQGAVENLRFPARLLTRNKGARWFELSGVPLEWQGQPATLNFLTDITERKQEDELVHELAYHDTLTGLANRRLLLDHLELALASNRRHGRHGALLFLDLDNFKPLNDRHGHHMGDLLLVEVARRLLHCVRELDTVARFGGDEFVVLLSGLATTAEAARQQAAQVAEKARCALAEPYRLVTGHDGPPATVEHHCTASVGVLLFTGSGEREGAAEALLDQADAAMYQAKQAGGNAVSFSLQPPA